MPAELLPLASGALGDADVDKGQATEVHRLVEGAEQILPNVSIILTWHCVKSRLSILFHRGFEPGRLLIDLGVLADDEGAGQQKHERNRDQGRQ